MHRGLALLLALGACGYPPLAKLEDAGETDSDHPTSDAVTSVFCEPSDPHLVACYEFEGNARDGSSHHLDAATSDIAFVAGKVGQAIQISTTSAANVLDSPALDIATLTMEAWINPSQLPAGGTKAYILDVDSQYAFWLDAGGVQCILYQGSKMSCAAYGGPTVDPAVATSLAIDRWSHVACTYDGSATVVYVDGSEVARAAGSGVSPTNGTTGMSIAADNPSNGNRLIGLIDQLRLMNVARTAAEICTDAGKPSCP